MYTFSIESLKQKFAETGLSYKALQESSGVNQMTLHRIFNNDSYKPSISHIVLICNALKVSPKNLFFKQ